MLNPELLARLAKDCGFIPIWPPEEWLAGYRLTAIITSRLA
jgi:hypothetical protein